MLLSQTYFKLKREETLKVFEGSNSILSFSFERELLSRGCNDIVLMTSHLEDKLLILGYGQDIKTLNIDEIRRNELSVIRRSSGGTAVLSTNSLNVSLFFPDDSKGFKGIIDTYKIFLELIKESLSFTSIDIKISELKEKVESPLCFLSQAGETLLFKGKKFFGSSQARNKNVILVHGTMLLDFDLELHHKIFGFDKNVLENKITAINIDIAVFKNLFVKNVEKKFNKKFEGGIKKISPSKYFIEETKTEKWMPKI